MRALLCVAAALAPASGFQLASVARAAPSARRVVPSALRAGPSEADEVLYAIGLSVTRSLGELKTLLTVDERRVVGKAIAEAICDEERADFEWDKYGALVEPLLTERKERVQKEASAAGAAFLEKAAAEAGAVKTGSGLVYRETQAGEGASPAPGARVTAHYTGRLVDGTVFDSSVARGEPLTFPLETVIKGWQEGLALMKEGGKATLTIPSELGYGSAGAGPIPAGATLCFEVELIKVEQA